MKRLFNAFLYSLAGIASAWRDEAGTDWNAKVKFTLPDFDLFAIDANAALPVVASQVSDEAPKAPLTVTFNFKSKPVSGPSNFLRLEVAFRMAGMEELGEVLAPLLDEGDVR